MSTSRLVSGGIPLAVFIVIGCGGPSVSRVPVFPVAGEVTVKGQPAANARVTFFAQDRNDGSSLEAEALTDLEGKFQMTTYETGDGLPPGKYAVRITWPEVITDDAETSGDRLKGAYNNPKKPAFIVEVKAEKNQIPRFELK